MKWNKLCQFSDSTYPLIFILGLAGPNRKVAQEDIGKLFLVLTNFVKILTRRMLCYAKNPFYQKVSKLGKRNREEILITSNETWHHVRFLCFIRLE